MQFFLYSLDVQKVRYVIKLRFYRSKSSVVMKLFLYLFVYLLHFHRLYRPLLSTEVKKRDRCNTRVGNTDAFIVLFASNMQVISNDCDITEKT